MCCVEAVAALIPINFPPHTAHTQAHTLTHTHIYTHSRLQTLAYKKYQHVPLYIEWAPQGIFSTPPPSKEQQQQQQASRSKTAKAAVSKDGLQKGGEVSGSDAAAEGVQGMEGVQGAGSGGGGQEGEDDEESVSTLYVKNLAFATTDAALKKHFDKVRVMCVCDVRQ